MFHMSNWVSGNIGYYIGYMIAEAFSSTAINMVCAYIAASIPYANATFTLHYYYAILMGSYYITDSFLFTRHPSVRTFWQWFSYTRMWMVPAMRIEVYGQPIYCLEREKFPFDSTGISVRGIGGAAKNLTSTAATANTNIVSQLNSFDIWQNAAASVNETVNSLYSAAYNLDSLQKARAAAAIAGSAPAVLSNLDSMLGVATVAFSSAVQIPATSTEQVNLALNQTVRAASMLGFANYLAANPLPPAMTCFYSEGEQYLASALAMECAFGMRRMQPPIINLTVFALPSLQGGSVTRRAKLLASVSTTS